MSRATTRMGCQDGQLDALAHMVGSTASGALSHDQSSRTGVIVAVVRIPDSNTSHTIGSIRKTRVRIPRRAVVLVARSSDLERLPEHSIDSVVILLRDYNYMDNALHSHARQPAEHRVALVPSLWGQHTIGQQTRDEAESSIPCPVRATGEPARRGSSHHEITLRDADYHAGQQHFATAHATNESDPTDGRDPC